MVTLNYPNVFYGYLAAVIVVAIISSFLSYRAARSEWYDDLEKPSLANEKMLFGVVWFVLYTLMVVGGYYSDIATIENKPKNWLTWIRVLFGLQLLFGLLWCLFFFCMRSFVLALISNILLVITLIALMVLYIQVAVISFWVFVPILVWSCYALWMTYVVWKCNRGSNCMPQLECDSPCGLSRRMSDY